MEVKLNISRRWTVTSPEYISTIKYVQERKYQRALDRLQRLVVQRLFELHRLNLSGIGMLYIVTFLHPSIHTLLAYKACSHLSKSLRTRSRAIRNATAAFNKAARELDPPRAELDWTRISRFNYIEEFNLLKDCRTDIRETPWAEPVIREAMKQRLRIKRANEEIIRCNIEVRRLHSHIYDEKERYSSILHKLGEGSSPIYVCVEEYCTRRQRINDYLLEQIQHIFNLPGFSGGRTIGHRIGRDRPSDPGAQPHAVTVPLPGDVSVSDGEDESDDEENVQVSGLIDFIGSLTFTT
jgi:hypothetical protein